MKKTTLMSGLLFALLAFSLWAPVAVYAQYYGQNEYSGQVWGKFVYSGYAGNGEFEYVSAPEGSAGAPVNFNCAPFGTKDYEYVWMHLRINWSWSTLSWYYTGHGTSFNVWRGMPYITDYWVQQDGGSNGHVYYSGYFVTYNMWGSPVWNGKITGGYSTLGPGFLWVPGSIEDNHHYNSEGSKEFNSM